MKRIEFKNDYVKLTHMKKLKQQRGITLVALVITIILLLILSGIAIGMLGGENGLFAKTKKAKEIHIKAEMKEQLILSVQDSQAEKLGRATLDDITQDWLNNKIGEYSPTIIEDPSINGKIIIMIKDGVTGKFLIDQNLNITEIEYNQTNIEFSYDTIKIVDTNKVQVLIHVREKINGLTKVEFPDQAPFIANGTKDEQQINYEIELGKEYKITIIAEDGNKEEKVIKIDDYYYKITKSIENNVIIDNNATKAAYNKIYEANITTEENYGITGLTVTMGGQAVTTAGNNIVDITTGKIYIEKVTGDIEITVTSKKLEIQYTTIAIGTSSSASNTSSENDNSQTKGTPLYINIIANLEGIACTVTLKDDSTKTVPYKVTENGKYTFIVSGKYNGKTIREEKEVTVSKYQSAAELVQYDAGDWTEGDIQSLQTAGLYNLNASCIANKTADLNFTFGGFTNKESSDATNSNIVTNKNKSVKIGYKNYVPQYDGWQLLEKETKQDGNGNIIKNADGTDRIYVKKIVHAGCPENFVYYYTTNYDNKSAEYVLSSGLRQTEHSTYSARSWQMYVDDSKKNLIEDTTDKDGNTIKDIHVMTYNEALAITGNTSNTTEVRNTGSYYWLSYVSTSSNRILWYVNNNGGMSNSNVYCFGIRPVISMKPGVYIKSGDGVEGSPYILGIEQ